MPDNGVLLQAVDDFLQKRTVNSDALLQVIGDMMRKRAVNNKALLRAVSDLVGEKLDELKSQESAAIAKAIKQMETATKQMEMTTKETKELAASCAVKAGMEMKQMDAATKEMKKLFDKLSPVLEKLAERKPVAYRLEVSDGTKRIIPEDM